MQIPFEANALKENEKSRITKYQINAVMSSNYLDILVIMPPNETKKKDILHVKEVI